jgi:hypothetical protein
MRFFCNVLLIFVAVLALLCGIFGIIFGTTAVHQILTAIYFVTFTIAVTGIGIMSPNAKSASVYVKGPGDILSPEQPRVVVMGGLTIWQRVLASLGFYG